MTLDATVVVPGIVLTASGLFWSLLRAASIASRIEERITSTLHRTFCDKCSREWEWVAKPFDPDLGATFDRTETCPACRMHTHPPRYVEVDLEKDSADDIRRMFDDGISLGRVTRAGGRRSAPIGGRSAHERAGSSA